MARSEMFFGPMAIELDKYGFKYVKSKNGFVKKENGNEYWFKYELWSPFYAIESSLSVLIGEVEKIKKNAWGQLYEKKFSVGSNKSRLIEIPSEGVIKTDTDDKILDAIKEETRFFKEFSLHFYKENINYTYLNKVLNSKLGANLWHCYNPFDTSFLAVIIAKLVNDSRIDEIYEFYRNVILAETQVSWIEEYDMLISYLKTME